MDSQNQSKTFADDLATLMLLTVVWEPCVGGLGDLAPQSRQVGIGPDADGDRGARCMLGALRDLVRVANVGGT